MYTHYTHAYVNDTLNVYIFIYIYVYSYGMICVYIYIYILILEREKIIMGDRSDEALTWKQQHEMCIINQLRNLTD